MERSGSWRNRCTVLAFGRRIWGKQNLRILKPATWQSGYVDHIVSVEVSKANFCVRRHILWKYSWVHWIPPFLTQLTELYRHNVFTGDEFRIPFVYRFVCRRRWYSKCVCEREREREETSLHAFLSPAISNSNMIVRTSEVDTTLTPLYVGTLNFARWRCLKNARP
jgi:hypothetical protein